VNIVTRRHGFAPVVSSRPSVRFTRNAPQQDALAHVPCFGMELLERRILYDVEGAYQLSDMVIEPRQ
jgi:hypothetical protein